MAALLYRVTLCVLALSSLEVKGFNHGGHDFYVTFLPYPLTDANTADEVKLYITTPETVPVTFTINIPGMGYFIQATVDPGGVREFTFNGADYALRNTTDRSKGIIIKTENEKQVFVYAAHVVYRTADSLLVLPPHDLGVTSYTYIAAMIHTLNNAVLTGAGARAVDIHALVGIVSGEDDTFLTITPNRDVTIGTEPIKAGESVLVTLARAETLLIAFVGDLTGTKVTSNRPISFFSGDQCTNIPSGVRHCDQIVEQLPPVEAWGSQFATAPLKTRSFDVFRIVASANSTFVIIRCTHRSGSEGYVDAFVLNEGGYTDVQVSGTDFCWMEADKRILLLQFAVGTRADSMPGDPFMALVPAVSHYTNTFTLPVVDSSLNDFTHYLNIIIPAEHYQPDQILLDRQSLQSLALELVAIVHNGETMAYATQLEVSATTHTLTHGNSKGLLGVVSYGFSHRSSYGHIGGMQLPEITTCSRQLRLVGGGDQYAGRVEVLFGGVWQTVCDDSWGILEANVVCQQLGYGTGRSAVSDSHFGEGGSSQWERSWLCTGTERCLEDCTSFFVSDSTRCSSDQNAGVICSLSSVVTTADGIPTAVSERASTITAVVVGVVVGAILFLLCICCGTVITVVVVCLCCATTQRRARGARSNASSTSPRGGSHIPMGNVGKPVPAYNSDMPTGGGSANQPPPATYLPGSYTVPSAEDPALWPTGTKEQAPAPPYPADTHNDLPPAYNSLLATPYPNDQGPPPPTSQYHYYAGTGPSAPSAPVGPQ